MHGGDAHSHHAHSGGHYACVGHKNDPSRGIAGETQAATDHISSTSSATHSHSENFQDGPVVLMISYQVLIQYPCQAKWHQLNVHT